MKVTSTGLAPARWRCTRGAPWRRAAGRSPRRARCAAITQEDEVTREMIGTRCERGAEIARMLELAEDTAQAIRGARRALGRQRPAARAARRGDPAARADPLPRADRRGVRHARSGCAARSAMALQATRPLVRPGAGRRAARRPRRPRVLGPLEDAARRAAGRGVGAGRPRADRRRRRLDRVADAFARVIDAKSPYTARHSAEVARWAVATGARARAWTADELRDLRRAGAAARHRQARGLQPDPRQAGPARADGVRRASASTRATRSRSSSASPCLRGIVATAAVAPRAARRHRLPPRAGRARPLAPGADPGRRGHLRGADRRPAVPRGDAAREGAVDRARAARDGAVPVGGRRVGGGGARLGGLGCRSVSAGRFCAPANCGWVGRPGDRPRRRV